MVGRWFAENQDFLMTMSIGLSRTNDRKSFWHNLHLDEYGIDNGKNFKWFFDNMIGNTDSAKPGEVKALHSNNDRMKQARINRLQEKQQRVQQLFQRVQN